jgi:hypothetical protein
MRTNHRRDKKAKDGKKIDHEQWEDRAKTMKAQRRERHKAKNQKAHQWSKLVDDDELDMDY